MDERDGSGERRGDEMPQDGMGRDMAHGGREDDRYQGGSTGRSTGGRAGGDLLGLVGDGASGGMSADGREPRDASSRGRSERQGDGDASDGAALPRGTDEQSPAPHDDTMAAGGAQEGLDLAERDDVRRRDPSTH